jgi:large subunit ribosomal protein L22
MVGKAVAKYVRMSPRKIRYVMAPLRHRTVSEALSVLAATNRRACKPLAKAIRSAFANARQANPTLGEDQVVIHRLIADGGPVWKRFRAAAFGRAVQIRKPTAHITVELDRQSEVRSQKPAGRVRLRKKHGTKS